MKNHNWFRDGFRLRLQAAGVPTDVAENCAVQLDAYMTAAGVEPGARFPRFPPLRVSELVAAMETALLLYQSKEDACAAMAKDPRFARSPARIARLYNFYLKRRPRS